LVLKFYKFKNDSLHRTKHKANQRTKARLASGGFQS